MSKFFLIDGMSLVFRSYHALSRSGLTNPDGEPTGAIFGFANTITSLIDKYEPKHMLVVFDTREPTFRHDMYDEYKANRDEFPEDLVPQLEKIKELLDLLGIPQFEKDGYEADDIIATLAKKATDEKIDAYCLTNDKDFYQLVTDHIKILRPSTKGNDLRVVDYPEVKEKFGVAPDKVIDIQALIGDSVDNIPGVKGVGVKTATPLIEEYGSLEALYENLDNIKSKSTRKKLEENKENAFLSKKLVELMKDAPVELDMESFEHKNTKFEDLDKFFETQNFRTLRKKWYEKSGKATPKEIEKMIKKEEEAEFDTIEDVDTDYKMISSKKELNDLIKEMEQQEILSVDLETSSLDKQNTDIVGIAVSFKEKTGYYIPVISDKEKDEIDPKDKSLFEEKEIDKNEFNRKLRAEKSLPTDYVIKKLKPVFEDESIGKCGQNLKFDQYILKRYDIELNPVSFDSMLASYVLNPDEKHNLDALSQKWLDYKPVPINSLIGEKKKTQKSMADLNPEDISDYACEDADLAFRLKNILEKEVEKSGQKELAYDIEFPTVRVLNTMEFNGIKIDEAALSEIRTDINERIAELEKEIYEEAGTEFNIDSPKQLGHILFEKLNIPPIKKTKTGYSTNVQVLNQLKADHPIAKYVLEYRQLAKLRSTYVDSLPKMVDKNTGRIHTTYNQTVASTGRLSSTDPNLQNIPIRTEMGKKIRKVFVASEKNTSLMSADYSQVELRIMAHICGDEKMIKGFSEGVDIHSATSAVLYDVSLDEVTQDMRRIAKTVNFGIMYGLGAYGLAERLNISRTDAKDIIDNYKEKYPGIIKYMDETVEKAKEQGYAETLCGRRRYFKNINSKNRAARTADERAAINMPIQGTASDMMKIAMINIDKEMRKQGVKSKMLLQVHDELIFEVYEDEKDKMTKLVKELMEGALSLGEVPVEVETGIANNWFDAH